LEFNMVDGLFFCAPHRSRRRGHAPFVQAGVEASDTGAEVVELDLLCFLRGHFRGVGAGVGDESTQSRSVVQPLRIPPVILPDRHMYVFVVR